MQPIKNEIMLITYADSMGGDLKSLYAIMEKYFAGTVGGVHLLPFYPSSGDRGFAVINYDQVDPSFGDWGDIRRFADRYYLMADFMINHVSIRCDEFADYMAHGDDSPYRSMFIHWDEFWPGGEPSAADLDALYRRKQQGPYKVFTRADGRQVRLWNTFFEEQVDIDPWAPATQAYYERNLEHLAGYVPLIRFDAFAYAAKRPGTSCFFVEPEVWEVLDIGMRPLRRHGTAILPEIHEHYQIQLKMAEQGHWVYDFALPMLLLHALASGRADRLLHWLEICPRKQFTTLDTHDGIGVVDVAGLLDDDEIDLVRGRVNQLTADLRQYSPFLSSMVSMPGAQSRQYQMMCTYYSALEADDAAYLLARAVQFYAPGIPQVYYVGLLAGENDVESLKRLGEPRSVNRHNYTENEIAKQVQRPVLRSLHQLMRFRNTYPAFGGTLTLNSARCAEGVIGITWRAGEAQTTLQADFRRKSFQITYDDAGETKVLLLS
jgi:sucrose phosphorylase